MNPLLTLVHRHPVPALVAAIVFVALCALEAPQVEDDGCYYLLD